MFKKGLLFSKFSHDLGSPFFNETLKMSFLPDLCCPGKARELAAVGPRVPLRDFARLTPTRPWSGTTHSSNSDSLRLLTASIFQCIIISPNSFPYRKDYYHSRKLYGKRLRAKFAHYWFSSLFYYYSAQRIPMFFEGARKRERAKKIRKKELLSLQKKARGYLWNSVDESSRNREMKIQLFVPFYFQVKPFTWLEILATCARRNFQRDKLASICADSTMIRLNSIEEKNWSWLPSKSIEPGFL